MFRPLSAHIKSFKPLSDFLSLSYHSRLLRTTEYNPIQFTMAPRNTIKKVELAGKLALRSRERNLPVNLPCLRCAKWEGLPKTDSDDIIGHPHLEHRCTMVRDSIEMHVLTFR